MGAFFGIEDFGFKIGLELSAWDQEFFIEDRLRIRNLDCNISTLETLICRIY